MPFNEYLRLIKQGDRVQAGVVNTPIRQIDQNARYLYDLINAAALGSTVYARRQTVEAEAAVGMAVYLDTASAGFKRALAVADVDVSTGVVATAASAQVWGIVSGKHSATLADILLFGLDEVDLTAAVDGTVAAGTYYLSGGSPGKLVRQRPPVSAAVLRRTADGKVFVNPQFVDYLDRHSHYRFDLACVPAGDTSQPAEGDLHEIANGDAALPGWLPADHPAFEGKAPAGAVFGYNLSAHPALANVWPPVPVSNAGLDWNKGTDADVGFTGVPLGSGGLAVLDRYGIWWMSNCYGDVPWPLDFNSAVSASYSDSAGSECPRHLAMGLTLYFSRVNFATDSAVVLSLRSADARLKVHCYGDPTRAAATGDLEITLDLNLVVSQDAAGYKALKDFDPATSTFTRGPLVEGVYTTATNVNLSGDETETRTIDSVSRTIHKGVVRLTVDPADTKELDVQLVRLDGVREEFFDDPPLMYLEFPAATETEYRGKLHVPDDLAIESPNLTLRFAVLGRAAGTLPQLEFTARRVPRPAAGLTTPLDLPDSAEEFAVVCGTSAVVASNQYVEAESDPFEVAAGDTVFFTVRRTAVDGYAGAVGVIRQSGVAVPAP